MRAKISLLRREAERDHRFFAFAPERIDAVERDREHARPPSVWKRHDRRRTHVERELRAQPRDDLAESGHQRRVRLAEEPQRHVHRLARYPTRLRQTTMAAKGIA